MACAPGTLRDRAVCRVKVGTIMAASAVSMVAELSRRVGSRSAAAVILEAADSSVADPGIMFPPLTPPPSLLRLLDREEIPTGVSEALIKQARASVLVSSASSPCPGSEALRKEIMASCLTSTSRSFSSSPSLLFIFDDG